jgi:hypothetical protein
MNTQLADLMHRATENLEPVSTDLLERTVEQGIRLRRRRTTLLSVTGASAVLATAGIVVAGTQLVGNPSDAAVAGTTKPSAAPSSVARPAAVTPKETLATLKSLIEAPGLTLSKPQTWGDQGFNAAAYLVNDGKGVSRVEVLVSGGGEQDRCATPGIGCTKNPDGSTLFTVTEQPEYAGNRNVDGVVSNYVALRLKDGRFISLTSYNAPAEKGTRHTRTKPLFTVAQLTSMVESKAWKFPPETVTKPAKGTVNPKKITK